MRRKILCLVLVAFIALTALLAVACKSPSSERRTTPNSSATGSTPVGVDLVTSGERFDQVASYRVRFAIAAETLDGKIEGESAYRSHQAVYARTSLVGSQLPNDALLAYLFLPPDLYLQQGDGTWFVQSPWNQGIRPGEEPKIGLQGPIINFRDLSRVLHDVEQGPDESIGGEGFQRYRGKVYLSDLPSLVQYRKTGVATAEVWIAKSSGLPGKVEIKASGEDGFLATIDFTDYNTSLAPPDAPADARPLRDAQFPDAPCIGSELAGCLEAQTEIQGAGSCAGNQRRVCLSPLGKISPDLVDHLVSMYRNQYGLSVTVLTPAAIPAELEDPKRQQVDAARLIAYMGSLFPDAYRDPQAVLIGITPVDLYDSTSHFRYVFGVKGTPSDPKAVVSVSRMNPQFYSEAADGLLFYARTRKLISKYVGLLYYRLPTSSDPASPVFNSILGPGDVDRMTEPLPVAGAR